MAAKFSKVVSFFKTTLAQGMTDSQTTMVLTDVPGGAIEYPTWIMIEPDSDNKEMVYVPSAPSSTTYSGITRGLDYEADVDTAGVGFAKGHAANVNVLISMSHRHWNNLVDVMDGTSGTGATIFRIGDDTDSNVTIYAQNADASKPFVRYDAATNKWLISNDGVSTYDISAGGSGLTAGQGITISGSAITTKLNASGLLVKNLGAGSDELGITTDTALALAGSSGSPSTSNRFVTQEDTTFKNPTGSMLMYMGNTAPSGWLLCNGDAVSRTTYATLFAALFPSVGTFTVTIASPGVVTLTSHGLATGDGVYLTTTGALPTGLAVNTRYWVIRVDANTFNLATSQANALAGTAINTSGSQSGTHTCRLAPAGIGDGSTTFNVPDLRQRLPIGKDQTDTDFAGLGQTGGAQTVTLTTNEMPAHTHTAPVDNSGTGGTARALANTNGAGTAIATSSSGSGNAFSILNPYMAVNFIIKT